ncbi:CTD phosphatase Fcp1 [Lecanora helva]
MQLRLPPSLHYPITVTELLKRPDDHVERFAPLFSYTYETKVTEGDGLGNEYQVLKKFPTRFESNIEGILTRWNIEEGAVIPRADIIADIEEPCAHSVQFGGMCASCGKDMTELTYNTDQLDSHRATINMVHDNVSLTVSADEATKVDDETKRRLLKLQKLSLVVDLDQTIIHATVDPTVGDWQKDESNPNHDAVKDVKAFLLDDDIPGKPGCWYYIKLRPGLEEFLESVSKIYELHIYTMGTRAYAKNIAKIIDPQEKVFGDRILSRTESGSMTAKNLQRLFPIDTKMVVIIDDRGDVWKWSPNLVKVTPYDFFVGIGDINSSFLPKKPEPRPAPKVAATAALKEHESLPEGVQESKSDSKVNGTGAESAEDSATPGLSKDSPLEQLVAMGGSDDASTREAQTNSQKETVDKQVEERPLLQKQKQLEAEDAATESAAVATEDGGASSSTEESSQSKHNLLRDHDRELYQLEKSLRSVHTEFFSLYDSNKNPASSSGGRVGELRGAQKKKAPADKVDLELVPDIKSVLPSVKAKVLKGVVIVFSGVIPLGMDVETTEIGILARTFGARLDEKVTRHTTHLVAARNRTSKVTEAKKRRIKIVTPLWLTDSVASWQKKDEMDYLLDPNAPEVDVDFLSSESDEPIVDDEEELDNDTTGRTVSKPGLTINTNPPSSEAGDTEPEIDFGKLNGSPVGGTHKDWADMNKEAEDFFGDLGSDSDDAFDPYDDDDNEYDEGNSIASEDRIATARGKKREREETESGSESDAERTKSGGANKRQALSHGLSSLSQTTNVEEEEGVEEEEPAPATGEGEGEAEDEEDDGWGDEMTRQFEEEMRRAQEEEDEDDGEG